MEHEGKMSDAVSKDFEEWFSDFHREPWPEGPKLFAERVWTSARTVSREEVEQAVMSAEWSIPLYDGEHQKYYVLSRAVVDFIVTGTLTALGFTVEGEKLTKGANP